jgi:hypothetical protein
VNELLPWERLLWSGRPQRLRAHWSGEQYFLTDFRLVRASRACADEIALQDIGEIGRTESRLDRLLGTSTIVVNAKGDDRPPFVIADIRRGAQLAALLELLATDPQPAIDLTEVRAALAWNPRGPGVYREALSAIAAVVTAIVAVVVGFHGRPSSVVYSPDDAIHPNGVKRSKAEIIWFMEHDVMPWARAVLGRLKGGPEHVSCETCHSQSGESRGWQMPGVAALPEPDFKERGWEMYSAGMDAQMRNAIYGYATESDKSAKAAYMREVVMPGMAALLHRPAYDFTRPYEYNRSHDALGCYHCHQVR